MQSSIELLTENSVVRNLPVNIDEADIGLFSKELIRIIPKSECLVLEKVWFSNETFVDPLRFKIYSENTHLRPLGKRRLFKVILGLFQIRKKTVKNALWLTDEWSNGYFHWMLDVLPKWVASEKYIKNHVLLLPFSLSQLSFVKDTLKLLNVPFAIVYPRDVFFVGQCLVPEYTAPTGNFQPSLVQQLRLRLKEGLNLGKLDRSLRKIYISRAKATKRKILNENEVNIVLAKFGYEIHHFEDYDFSLQVQIIHEASHLVSLHGAGLSNMLFLNKGSKVFEIRNNQDNHNNCYFSLSSALNLEYYYITAKGNSSNTFSVDITIDLLRFESVLKQMEN